MEARIDVLSGDPLRGELADRRPLLESMLRAASENPDVVEVRTTIDGEVAVRGVLGLTDSATDHGLPPQLGEAESNVVTSSLELERRNNSLVVVGIQRVGVVI